jgi:hypothetical protein
MLARNTARYCPGHNRAQSWDPYVTRRDRRSPEAVRYFFLKHHHHDKVVFGKVMGGPLYHPVKSGIHMLARNPARYCPGLDQEPQLLSPCVCGPLGDLAFEKFCSSHSKDGILLVSIKRRCHCVRDTLQNVAYRAVITLSLQQSHEAFQDTWAQDGRR